MYVKSLLNPSPLYIVDLTCPISSSTQIVYICWLAFEAVYLYLFIIETKGLSLEETAALFDGEDATAHIAAQGAVAQNQGSPTDEKASADSIHEHHLAKDA